MAGLLTVAAGATVAIVLWRRLRLRRALFALRQQVAWSRRMAPRRALVLDVGSGNNPHLRADVLCERHVDDDVHRGGAAARDRPLVAGDAAALPFRDGAFDCIVARALIEHVHDPAACVAEAGRVARAGLFVAPSALWEQCYSFTTHLWTIERRDGGLCFKAKPRPVLNPELQRFFAAEVFRDARHTDDFLLDHWEALRVTYEWTGRPHCTVHGTPGGAADGFVDVEPIAPPVRHRPGGIERPRATIKRWMRRAVHALLSVHRQVDWAAILACPACRAAVEVRHDQVQCQSCARRFPIEGGVPMMLLERALPADGPARHDVGT